MYPIVLQYEYQKPKASFYITYENTMSRLKKKNDNLIWSNSQSIFLFLQIFPKIYFSIHFKPGLSHIHTLHLTTISLNFFRYHQFGSSALILFLQTGHCLDMLIICVKTKLWVELKYAPPPYLFQ